MENSTKTEVSSHITCKFLKILIAASYGLIICFGFFFLLFIVLMVSLRKQHELLIVCALLAVQCFLSSSLCDADFRSIDFH